MSLFLLYLILNVPIAELQTDQVLKGFKEGLVEVEVGLLRGVLEEGGHDPVDVLNRLLRDHVLTVASSLESRNRLNKIKSAQSYFY